MIDENKDSQDCGFICVSGGYAHCRNQKSPNHKKIVCIYKEDGKTCYCDLYEYDPVEERDNYLRPEGYYEKRLIADCISNIYLSIGKNEVYPIDELNWWVNKFVDKGILDEKMRIDN